MSFPSESPTKVLMAMAQPERPVGGGPRLVDLLVASAKRSHPEMSVEVGGLDADIDQIYRAETIGDFFLALRQINLRKTWSSFRRLRQQVSEAEVVHLFDIHSPHSVALLSISRYVVLSPFYHANCSGREALLVRIAIKIIQRRKQPLSMAYLSETERESLTADFPAFAAMNQSKLPMKAVVTEGARADSTAFEKVVDVLDELGLRTGAYVVTGGRHVAYKHHDAIIDAVTSSAWPVGKKLVITGRGPRTSDLQLQVQKLGLDESVCFAGLVSRRELAVLIENAAVFVSMSVAESYGLMVAEAMHLGAPCVLSDEAYHRELAVDYSASVAWTKPTDSAAIAVGVARMTNRSGAAASPRRESRPDASLAAIYKAEFEPTPLATAKA